MSHPIPMVSAMLSLINAATSVERLLALVSGKDLSDADKRTTSMFKILTAADQDTVRSAWAAKRSALLNPPTAPTGWESVGTSTEDLANTLVAAAQETAGDGATLGTQGNSAEGTIARRGVGFADPQGYLVALQRGGLQPHTREEYLRTVVAHGLATTDTFPPANVVSTTPAGPGITHNVDPNRPGFVSQRNQARRRNAAQNTNSPEGRAAAIAAARAAGAVLAGYDGQVVDPSLAGDIGTVVLFGRHAIASVDPITGRRRQELIPWGDLETARVALKLPEGTFGRSPGSVGLLGAATQILNNGGYVARRIRAAAIPSFADPSVMVPVRTAWKIGHFDNRADSNSMGKREATIALVKDGSGVKLICDAPEHSGAKAVIADYERRVADTMIPSDDLVRRVEAAFRKVCGARPTDLGLYVAPACAGRAVDIANALRPILGRNVYAYAFTDKATLSEALTDSLVDSIDKLEREIERKKADGKLAVGMVGKVETLKVECAGLAAFLGPDVLESYKGRLQACELAIVEGLDATSQRAGMLELDLDEDEN